MLTISAIGCCSILARSALPRRPAFVSFDWTSDVCAYYLAHWQRVHGGCIPFSYMLHSWCAQLPLHDPS